MEFERTLAMFTEDRERSITLVVELLGRSVGGDMGSFQPDSITYLKVMRGGPFSIICAFHVLGRLLQCRFSLFVDFSHPASKILRSFHLSLTPRVTPFPGVLAIV